jgi:hypothetical protein
MTLAAIYHRHVDAIAREQPWRRAEPSRLDGEVAARMAVTGHSREQITDAIRAEPSSLATMASTTGRASRWSEGEVRLAQAV